MDFNIACMTLEINSPFSLTELKRHYRIMALKNHPDKHVPDTGNIYAEKFKKIGASYEHLTKFLENKQYDDEYTNETSNSFSHNNDSMDYNSLFTGFLSSFFSNNHSDVKEIISTILTGCQNISVSLFENMDTDRAIKIFEFINTYHHILYISTDIVEKIKEIINNKIKHDNIIIINPSMNDLLKDNIYMMDFEDEKYYVPLWHDEIYYKHNGNNLIVKCIPDLPENITLDNDNNLVINIYINSSEIFNIEKINCGKYGDSDIYIPVNELKIVKIQKYVFKNIGVSTINYNDIYDNENKSNIIFIIHIQ